MSERTRGRGSLIGHEFDVIGPRGRLDFHAFTERVHHAYFRHRRDRLHRRRGGTGSPRGGGTRCSASPAPMRAAKGARRSRGQGPARLPRGPRQPAGRAAAASDGVIHLGFIHDFSRFREVCEAGQGGPSRRWATRLAGSDRPFVITSGTGMGTRAPGELATEDHFNPDHPNPRAGSEIAAEAVIVAWCPRDGGDDCRRCTTRRSRASSLPVIAVALASSRASRSLRRRRAQPLARGPSARCRARLQAGPREGGRTGARYSTQVAEEGVTARAIAGGHRRGALKIPVVSPVARGGRRLHFGWLRDVRRV